MKRRVPGLHSTQESEAPLEGVFLVRVEWASYRWHPQKPFLSVRFVVLEPDSLARRSFSGRFYCTERALWKLNLAVPPSATQLRAKTSSCDPLQSPRSGSLMVSNWPCLL
jgi:hypothetical protein